MTHTTPKRIERVPFTGDEKSTLLASLDQHRDIALWKLEGLDDEQLRRPLTPTGTNLLGLVKHLAAIEYGWFCETFGYATEKLWFADEDDMALSPDETTAQIVELYGRARTASDRVVADLDLDHLGTSWDGTTVSLRWVLVHMIEDTVRHTGHMDIVRELIDGATGDYRTTWQ
ncbi:DinB family protein [Streptomyces sp. NPDC048442]|uniref:DinB family protein n=1 Tax=Streptomyces sp. NPDC048442 TaxID=3154823 RepID=UPI0034226872